MAKSPFEHIVVLMMENQSFDRIFGFVKGIGQLTGEEFNLNSKGEKFLSPKVPTPTKIIALIRRMGFKLPIGLYLVDICKAIKMN